MYKRLMRFVEDAKANESLSDYDSKHSSTLEAIREAEERIQHFREYQGFQGQTGDAINKWLEDAERRVRLIRFGIPGIAVGVPGQHRPERCR